MNDALQEEKRLRDEAERSLKEEKRLRDEAECLLKEEKLLREAAECALREEKRLRDEAERALKEEKRLREVAEHALQEKKRLRDESEHVLKESRRLRVVEECTQREKERLCPVTEEAETEKAPSSGSLTEEGFRLSEEQATVVELLDSTRENCFVTGKAGTGKSVLLRYFISNTSKRIAVVAPTGLSAININGQTIHSLFGLAPTLQDVEDKGKIRIDDKRKQLLKALDGVVIDEVSMVRSDVMDMIDRKLRIAKECDIPFGGCQIIAFGDLYQLSPIVGNDKNEQRFIKERYGSPFFFDAPGVKERPFKIVELTTIHRQRDRRFIDILNAVRVGKKDLSYLNMINRRRITVPSGSTAIIITPTNKAADRINGERLLDIPAPEYKYPGTVSGEFKPDETPTDIELRLKEGAQVMMIKNDPDRRWVNGTTAIVAELTPDRIGVCIDGQVWTVNQETWTKYRYEFNKENQRLEQIEVGSFKQYPLKLAYAITIHKAQGQTYESVIIDYSMGRAFAPGQTYVALSRCRSPEGLFLNCNLAAEDIKVDQQVVHFMSGSNEA